MNITAADALKLDLMSFLEAVPRRERVKYGKRRNLSSQEKAEVAKLRNREHAAATRERRKIYAQIIESRLTNLDESVVKFLDKKSSEFKTLKVNRLKHQTNVTLFSYLDTDAVFNKEAWKQICLEGALNKFTVLSSHQEIVQETYGCFESVKFLRALSSKFQAFVHSEFCHKSKKLISVTPGGIGDLVLSPDGYESDVDSVNDDGIMYLYSILNEEDNSTPIKSIVSPILTRLRLLSTLEPISPSDCEFHFKIAVSFSFSYSSISRELIYESSDLRILIRQVEEAADRFRISRIDYTVNIDLAVAYFCEQIKYNHAFMTATTAEI